MLMVQWGEHLFKNGKEPEKLPPACNMGFPLQQKHFPCAPALFGQWGHDGARDRQGHPQGCTLWGWTQTIEGFRLWLELGTGRGGGCRDGGNFSLRNTVDGEARRRSRNGHMETLRGRQSLGRPGREEPHGPWAQVRRAGFPRGSSGPLWKSLRFPGAVVPDVCREAAGAGLPF